MYEQLDINVTEITPMKPVFILQNLQDFRGFKTTILSTRSAQSIKLIPN